MPASVTSGRPAIHHIDHIHLRLWRIVFPFVHSQHFPDPAPAPLAAPPHAVGTETRVELMSALQTDRQLRGVDRLRIRRSRHAQVDGIDLVGRRHVCPLFLHDQAPLPQPAGLALGPSVFLHLYHFVPAPGADHALFRIYHFSIIAPPGLPALHFRDHVHLVLRRIVRTV